MLMIWNDGEEKEGNKGEKKKKERFFLLMAPCLPVTVVKFITSLRSKRYGR